MRRAVADAAALHAELFAEYSEATAKKVSRLEREAKELANRSLAYGEIPFQTVDAIFQFVSQQTDSCCLHVDAERLTLPG